MLRTDQARPRPETRALGAPRDGALSLLDAFELVPPAVARRRGLVPLRFERGRLVAGTLAPDDLRVTDALARLGHRDVSLEAMPEKSFREVMETRYGPSGEAADFVARLQPTPAGEPSFDRLEDLESSPAPRYLDLTLRAALAEGASDVHLERCARRPRVRFRVDGVLMERVAPPEWLFDRVLGRLKSLAGLALGDCLFAQDGQFELETPRGPLSIRVSLLPTDRAECAVLRLLCREGEVPDLAELGMDSLTERRLRRAVRAPNGLIVLAGPTGSGKTTTLHSLLATLDGDRCNIVSIEEPVEIRSPQIRQVPVRRETGLDFAGVLRHVLRQDPDVILVGETRDEETARLVVQASLAGHLVLTTVHAPGALQIFDRLTQLGAEPRLLAQVLHLAVSQRLLRGRCGACEGSGCVGCDGSGYRGRLGVFEALEVDDDVASAIERGSSAGLRRSAEAAGFRDLRQRARDLVRQGLTTEAEVERVMASRPSEAR